MLNKSRSKNISKSQKGFSLIELIVVIAIISVLVGVVAPQVLQYIGKNRIKACETDRENILSVYKRCVYGGELDVIQGDADMVVNKSYTANPGAMNEIKECSCPKGGTYTAEVVDNKVYIKCDQCGTEVMADFAGWSGIELAEGLDDPYATPTPTAAPTATPTPSPTPTATPTPEPPDTTWWPYSDSDKWGDNPQAGISKYTIDVPTGIKTSRDGNLMVVIDKNSNGKFTLQYEQSTKPEYYENEWVVMLSGVVINNVEYNKANQIINVNFGDIVVIDGVQWVYFSHNACQENWNNPGSANKNGNFYRVNP